jgi:hypothetical protein
MRNPEYWFDEEFVQFHNTNIYDYPIGTAPFIAITENKLKFLLYRFEDLPHSFGSLIETVAPSPLLLPPQQRKLNVAVEKIEGDLYETFIRTFTPTQVMLRYYFSSRYFAHFYREYY